MHRHAAGAILVTMAGICLIVLIFASLTVDFANNTEQCAIEKSAKERDSGPVEKLTAVRAFNGIVIGLALVGVTLSGIFGGILIFQAYHSPRGISTNMAIPSSSM
jgi:hypothetical protein